MTYVARTSPTSFATGSGPVRPAPSSACPVQAVLLEEKQTESNGNRSGWICCLLPDRRPVSPPTRSDAPHRYLHHTAGRSPGQDGTRCLFPQDIHSSSSVFLLSCPNRYQFSLAERAAGSSALMPSVHPLQKYSSQGERKRMMTKKTPPDEEIDGTYLQSIEAISRSALRELHRYLSRTCYRTSHITFTCTWNDSLKGKCSVNRTPARHH